MRLPDIYRRCRPKKASQPGAENRGVLLRKIAVKLGNMIGRADELGETVLGDKLEGARGETERLIAEAEPPSKP